MRTLGRPIAITFLFGFIAASVMIMSADARAAAPAADTPDSDEAVTPVATGDFNRDGIADIAEVTFPGEDRSGAATLTVLLGQRDGHFEAVGSTPVLGRDPRSIVVADFNGDGIPDVIVGDGDGSLMELLGDGTGNLIPAGTIARLDSVESITVADFNHDGKLDIAVSDPRSNRVSVFLGIGNGSFEPIWSFPLPTLGDDTQIAAADFNGDGIPDLVIANTDQDTFQVMLGNGNGTFTFAPELSKLVDPNSHCPT